MKVECGAVGNDLPIPRTISVNAENEIISLYSVLPFEVPEDKRTAVAVAASAANVITVAGSFDFNCMNGMLLFRMTNTFRGSLIGKEIFSHLIFTACQTVDAYNDKFCKVIVENMSDEEIVALMRS